MIEKLTIHIFDFLKKWNMDRYYSHGGQWGRTGPNEDITRAMALVSDRNYTRCLDVGAGGGYYAELASKICDAVLAVDISTEILKTGRRLAHLKNVRCEVRNLRSISPSWGAFDLIILAEVLYYLGDERFPVEFNQLLKHIALCVEPGGRVLLVNYVSPGRTERHFDQYAEGLVNAGLSLEKREKMQVGAKTFVAVVLKSNASTAPLSSKQQQG